MSTIPETYKRLAILALVAGGFTGCNDEATAAAVQAAPSGAGGAMAHLADAGSMSVSSTTATDPPAGSLEADFKWSARAARMA